MRIEEILISCKQRDITVHVHEKRKEQRRAERKRQSLFIYLNRSLARSLCDYPFRFEERKKEDMAASLGLGLGLGLFSTYTVTWRPQPAVATPPTTLRMVRATVSQPSTGKVRGIMKPRKISPEMQALCGVPEISRTQALKQIWAYIKDNNLQDPENKRLIRCDEKLKKVFAGRDEVGMLEIAGLISPHFLK